MSWRMIPGMAPVMAPAKKALRGNAVFCTPARTIFTRPQASRPATMAPRRET